MNSVSTLIVLTIGLSLPGAGMVALAKDGGLANSKHDISVPKSASNAGSVSGGGEDGMCNFCHGTHGSPGQPAMWRHEMSSAPYTPYTSSTLKSTVGQPTGASKLCLSCHDGTVAVGAMHSRPAKASGGTRNVGTTISPGPGRLGKDLSDDHPISMKYDAALAALNGELHNPSNLKHQVRLDGDGMVQCTSCHDPHNAENRKFLVTDDRGGQLCVTCHNVRHWETTSHRTSAKTWSGIGLDPWPHTDFKTVADNACENCHAPHNAGTRMRLLNFAVEEQNCNSCHGGTVASKNVAKEFNKLSVHPITFTSGLHDPMEDTINPTRHVECVDCHNPHATRAARAIAPNASGALEGLKGVAASGARLNPLSREYELCFRCHADSIARGPARVNRQVVQTNTRLALAPENASYHPVIAPGKNSYVPSLFAPWTVASVMYCTDCHNNDQGPGAGGAGPNGPHGSAFVPLLERELVLVDNTPESASAYALCYKCHNRSSILSDQSFSKHNLHVVKAQTACTTCHDSHGVQGKSHLINFNVDFVKPAANGQIEFVSTGTGRGNCTLNCHGKEHNRLAYP